MKPSQLLIVQSLGTTNIKAMIDKQFPRFADIISYATTFDEGLTLLETEKKDKGKVIVITSGEFTERKPYLTGGDFAKAVKEKNSAAEIYLFSSHQLWEFEHITFQDKPIFNGCILKNHNLLNIYPLVLFLKEKQKAEDRLLKLDTLGAILNIVREEK